MKRFKFTILIIISNILIFILFKDNMALRIVDGHIDSYWQLITYGFYHWGLSNLIGNMIMLSLVVGYFEYQFGSKRTTIIYISSIIGGGILYAYSHSTGINNVAGASSGIYGIMGALLISLILQSKHSYFILIILILGTITGFYQSISIPTLSMSGHLGGYLSGMAIAIINKEVTKWQ